MYKGTRVLVTGASGFIGKHLCRRLVASGAEVLPSSRAPGEWQLDVTQADQVFKLVDRAKPDIVFHLAACTAGRSWGEGAFHKVFQTNTAGTVYLLKACHQAEVGKCILVGSSDETRAQPNLYGLSKRSASEWAQVISQEIGLKLSVVRPYLVYGSGQSRSFFLPALLEAARRDEVFKMSHGRQTRDFVWVEDVADALVRLGAKAEHEGEIFDICTGVQTSLRELVGYLETLLGRKVKVDYGALPYRQGEPLELAGDPEPLARAVDFRARTSLMEGLKRLLSLQPPSLRAD